MGGNKLQIRLRSHTHKEGGEEREGERIMNEKKERKNKDK